MRQVFSLLFLLFLSHFANAQLFNQPLSRFGLGVQHKTDQVRLQQLQGINLAWSEKASFSLRNPATLSSVNLTNFSFGVTGERINYNLGGQSYINNTSNFAYFNLAFPIVRKWGWSTAFGVKPLNRVGFDFRSVGPHPSLNDTIFHSAEGGLNSLFLSNSFKINKNLSLGITASYIFGTVEEEYLHAYPSGSRHYSYARNENFNFGSVLLEGGILYQANLSKEIKLNIGAAGRRNREIEVGYDNFTRNVIDTLRNSEREPLSTNLPENYRFGFQFYKVNHWRIGGGYEFDGWSAFEFNSENAGLNDQHTYSFSSEWIPDYESYGNLFSRIAYRFGINYAQSYYNINNEQLTKFEVNLGLGLPIKRQASTVDLGIAYGNLGEIEQANEKTSYIKLMLGLSLSDKWFEKQKID